ncbi:MAG: SDR family oxidoreductase [Solirubrobacterales bacterium]|nr:SDR family oxidoreductase [Solirubrobacterales bacterium]
MARKQVKSVAGKMVAITGGARGIGKATALALIRRGARVAIGDLDLELAEKTAAELGGNAVAVKVDVTDRDSFVTFLDDAERELGPLDVLINNAGIMPLGRFEEETDETAKMLIDINLHGVIYGTKLALERMIPRRSGHIVNIASQAGKAGIPGGATYCATKHAVVGLSEAVRLENLENGIEISCVMPAVVNTELGSGLTDTRGVKKLEPEEVAEAIVEAIETNRFDVWVPRSSAGIAVALNMVPRSGREFIARTMKADKVLAEVDDATRASYEERAARSTAESAEDSTASEATAGS